MEFRDLLQEQGYSVDKVIPDGKIHRVNGPADTRGQRSGWYVFYGDSIPSGAYGDWHDGDTISWCSVSRDEMSADSRADFDQRIRQARESKAAETRARQATAASEVSQALADAAPCLSHPYLQRKGIKRLPGLKVAADGSLLVPMTDASGVTWSAQRIYEDGSKRYWDGGKVAGNYYLIGEPSDKLIIVEGLATGASVHEATGVPVAVAFDTGNLVKAGRNLQAAFPRAQLLFCGDNDRHSQKNAGVLAATKAAEELGVSCVFPEFSQGEGVDYNDLAALEGLDKVRDQIMGPDPLQRLEWIDADDWDGKEPTPLDWIWPGWVPRGYVTGIYGDGGTGKTLWTQQLATCCASGRPFFGQRLRQCRVMYVFCEDDPRAIHRRQSSIDHYYALQPGEKRRNLKFLAINDRPAALAKKVEGVWVWTDLMHDLYAGLQGWNAEVLIFDSLADAFPGNENDRTEVTTFMVATFIYLATTLNIGVIFLGHNSKGGGYSGGTAWNAKVKSRISMERNDEDASHVTAARVKANYAPIGEAVELYHANGVLIPLEEVGEKPVDEAMEHRKREIDDRILRVLLEGERINTPVKVSKARAEIMNISRAVGYGVAEETIDVSIARLLVQSRITQEGSGSGGKTQILKVIDHGFT